MNRTNRHFAALLILICVICSALIIPGCAGSGGGPEPLRLTSTAITATVILPSGSPITSQALTIWTSGGTSTTDTQNRTRVVIFNNGPQYTDARDSQGRLALAGYLGQGETTLNAESTAETMIFFAVGGAAQISDGPITVLNGIRNLTGFGEVADEISAQILSQGYISLQTGTLKEKIQSIVDSFGPPPSKSRGTIAEPTSGSGLFLDTLVDGEFKIQNNYLRGGRASLQRVSYTDSDGNSVESSGPVQKFDIASPSRYGGLTSTIAGVVTGDLTWTPTISPVLSIPLVPADAQSTTYKLTTLGLGASAGVEDTLTPEQISELNEVMLKSFFLDAVLPVLANIVFPLNGDQMDNFLKFSGGNTIMSDLIGLASSTLPTLNDLLRQGDVKGAISHVWNSGFTTNSALPLLLQLMQAYGEEYGDEALLDGLGAQSEKIAERLSALGFVDIFFSSADMAIFTADFARSDRANCFFITTTGGKITITAPRLVTCLSEPLQITATIQNKDPNAVYKYEWSTDEDFRIDSSNNSTVNDPNGILTTSQETVTFRPIFDATGQATINCKVTRIDGNNNIPVDQDTRVITVVQDPKVSPIPAVAELGGSATITASYAGPEPVLWKFTNNSPNLGSINRTSIGNNPDCTFTAGQTPGNAIIEVEMYLTINGQSQLACKYLKGISVGDGLRVDFHADWTVGLDPSIPGPPIPFFGVGVGYCTAHPYAGAGTYTLKIDGESVKTWQYPGAPPETGPFQGIRIKRQGGTFDGVWWVEVQTDFMTNFPSINDANAYASLHANQIFNAYQGKVFTLHHSPAAP